MSTARAASSAVDTYMDISGRKQHDVAAASIPAPVAATVAVVRAGSSSSCESDMSTPSHSASHGVGSQLAERRGCRRSHRL